MYGLRPRLRFIQKLLRLLFQARLLGRFVECVLFSNSPATSYEAARSSWCPGGLAGPAGRLDSARFDSATRGGVDVADPAYTTFDFALRTKRLDWFIDTLIDSNSIRVDWFITDFSRDPLPDSIRSCCCLIFNYTSSIIQEGNCTISWITTIHNNFEKNGTRNGLLIRITI